MILGHDEGAKPVQIVQKSVKNIKERSFLWEKFEDALIDEKDFTGLKDPDSEYVFKNIIPIPNALTKIFINLDSTTPLEVARAFMEKFSSGAALNTSIDSSASLTGHNAELPLEKGPEDEAAVSNEEKDEKDLQPSSTSTIQAGDILHIIQFCHLCSSGKITPVIYSLANDSEISDWFSSIYYKVNPKKPSSSKRPAPSTPDSDSDSGVSSPENKISKKDHYLINTMIKLHDTMDKSSKTKGEKEPGFKRLESHRKLLILNASAIPPFSKAADKPTEFLSNFLAKKSQFKAKDMLLHQFHADKIAFNPNSTFVTNLWNAEFFWILPDSPSGISIFYCPETKSSNSYELEKERNLALVDKVNQADLEKLAKQKLSLPSSLMDLVWTTQNFHAVLSLCFGPDSHSAYFLQGWKDHMYENRLLYSNMALNDPYFYAKFKIDNALQKHWPSCSQATDRASVNDNVLRMSDVQQSIIDLDFSQMLPKSISDKVLNAINAKDDKEKPGGGGKLVKKIPGGNPEKDKQELIYDNDKNHQHWKVKENENFSKIFYSNQKECPKTDTGKLICMKFFLRGVCVKTCNRAHSLSADDKKKLDLFVADCRAKAAKADF